MYPRVGYASGGQDSVNTLILFTHYTHSSKNDLPLSPLFYYRFHHVGRRSHM